MTVDSEMKTIVCALLLLSLSLLVKGEGWGYHSGDGLTPDQWSEHYPTCGGKRQSPINIVTSEVRRARSGPLEFEGYDSAPDNDYWLDNNGHSVVASNEQLSASISGGGLLARYNFAQFHIHWGSTNSQGSEHQIDGKAYPAEIHLVHLRDESNTAGDQIAVIGVFVEVGPEDNEDLAQFFTQVHLAQNKDDRTNFKSFPLRNVMPENVRDFYRYEGSLTTPGCDETVIWTVMKHPIKVSQSQLDELRSLQTDSGPLVDNFRPVQDLNGRTVTSSS